MASYRFLIQQLCGFFEGCEFHHVPRVENEVADALSKLGSTRQAIPAGVSLERISKPSIKPSPESESIYIPADPDPPAAGAAPQAETPSGRKDSTAPGAADPAPGAADSVPGAAVISSGTDIITPGAAVSGSQAPAAAGSAGVAVLTVVTASSWAQPILAYLENGDLPPDEVEAWQI